MAAAGGGAAAVKALKASGGGEADPGPGDAYAGECSTGGVLGAGSGNGCKTDTDCWTAGETCVLSGSDDGALHIWDAVSGRPIRTLEGHQGASYRAVWHARQGLLVSCGDDGTVRTWNYRSVLGGALD